jgi:hypothetical protein
MNMIHNQSWRKEDYDKALKLYNELKKYRNLNPWLDEKSILPGQKWKPTISEAIRKSRFFIALLSSNSVDKKGYVQKELKEALDIAQEYPEPAIYLIPARLDNCKVPHIRLQEIQYVNLFLNWDEGFRSILNTVHSAVDIIEDQSSLKIVHSADYDNGYRAGAVKGQQDVDAFWSGHLARLSGSEAPPCPLPDEMDYCKGWKKGYSDQVLHQMDDD